MYELTNKDVQVLMRGRWSKENLIKRALKSRDFVRLTDSVVHYTQNKDLEKLRERMSELNILTLEIDQGKAFLGDTYLKIANVD